MAAPTRAELEAIEQQQAQLTSHAGTTIGAGTVIRWPRDRATELLAQHERLAREGGEWPSAIVSEGLTEPADLGELLAAADWRRIGVERVMVTRHPPEVPHLEPDLRIEAITPRSAADCVSLETDVFGLDRASAPERVQVLAAGIEAGWLRALLVRQRGMTVASARLRVAGSAEPQRVSGLYGVAVAERQRRRGYGRLVTAVATRAGLASGHRLVWLSVAEDNLAALNLYRSLGFMPAFAWSRWLAPAPVRGGRATG